MSIYSLIYRVYMTVRKAARSTGHINILRVIFGPFAGRLLFRLAPGTKYAIRSNGHEMELAYGAQYPPIEMIVGNYEQETVLLFERRIRSGMRVVDIGAHVGFFTLLAAKLVGPTGEVYAFEAEPENYKILQSNINRNKYQNVTAENQAVSDNNGTAHFYLSGLDNGSHSLHKVRRRMTRGAIKVRETTLDAFFKAQGWPVIDLIKIDVEGAENMVIKGMQQVLALQPAPDLVIEFCPFLLEEAGNKSGLLIRTLQSLDYSVFTITDEANLTLLENDSDIAQLISSLLKRQTYINVFCTRGDAKT